MTDDGVNVGRANAEARREALAAYRGARKRLGDKADGPPAALLALAASLAAQAMMQLGAVLHPVTRTRTKDVARAAFLIDLLGVLEQKTRGNRTPEEERVLCDLLATLRRRFAELAAEPQG